MIRDGRYDMGDDHMMRCPSFFNDRFAEPIISCNGSTERLGGILSPIIHKSFNFPREKMVKIHQNNLFFPLRFHNYLLFSEKAAHFIYLLEFSES